VADHPWRAIGLFVESLLTRAGVVLDEKRNAIKGGWSCGLAEVQSLADNWRLNADAEILLCLIREMDDISQNDLGHLAGLLYHSRSDEGEEKVLQLVHVLLQDGRVTEIEEDGVRYLRLQK
jgi:hypothetical protein